MKRILGWMLSALLAVSLCGCAESAQKETLSAESGTVAVNTEQKAESTEINVETAEDFDSAYADALRRYFKAIEQKDFDGYKAEIYPPYWDKLTEYYSQDGKTMEEVFDTVCHRFDEDGYESWKITDITAQYYVNQKAAENGIETDDVSDFLDAFADAGIIDTAFKEDLQKAATDIRDVQFAVDVLYEGDEEPVRVVSGSEMLMLKTSDGTFLFG